ncbi:poly(3-hydroxyalkanoate) depolymerase [Aquimarina sp. I32.4]|uniref:poly(3-hydroxyalkanoate) depolymerase n=1 Tax=Aquimarina sp. I32.4 TaxID=2053903 RepID=UPI000CDEEB89|nr:poly(3-hydroxyalkanoate) depolymerase [Aquimarina sp. I32.4]
MNYKEIFELIVNNLREIVPSLENESISYESKLCLLGASSVGRAELIEKTLEDLKLDVDRFEFHTANNLGELADMFVQRISA